MLSDAPGPSSLQSLVHGSLHTLRAPTPSLELIRRDRSPDGHPDGPSTVLRGNGPAVRSPRGLVGAQCARGAARRTQGRAPRSKRRPSGGYKPLLVLTGREVPLPLGRLRTSLSLLCPTVREIVVAAQRGEKRASGNSTLTAGEENVEHLPLGSPATNRPNAYVQQGSRLAHGKEVGIGGRAFHPRVSKRDDS
jgi:hypothetical protein